MLDNLNNNQISVSIAHYHNQTPESGATAVTDLDGRLAGDVRHQKVHSDVLTVDVFVHHVPDGLRHHVGVQVGVVLGEGKKNNPKQQYEYGYRVDLFGRCR